MKKFIFVIASILVFLQVTYSFADMHADDKAWVQALVVYADTYTELEMNISSKTDETKSEDMEIYSYEQIKGIRIMIHYRNNMLVEKVLMFDTSNISVKEAMPEIMLVSVALLDELGIEGATDILNELSSNLVKDESAFPVTSGEIIRNDHRFSLSVQSMLPIAVFSIIETE